MKRQYSRDNMTYKALQKGHESANKVLKNKRLLLVSLIILVFLLAFGSHFKSIFFTGLLIILGAFSMIYQRYFKLSHYIGFELCMMATVLTGLAYGSIVAAITGFLSIFFGFVLSGNFKPTYFISVLTMPLIGVLVPIFRELPLLYVGLLVTLIYDAVILPLYMIIGGSRTVSSIIFFITHMMLNYWVFSTIAPIIYSLMV